MRAVVCMSYAMFFAIPAFADLPDLPLSDTRLSVSNLVREDIFAGWRSNDMQRFARA